MSEQPEAVNNAADEAEDIQAILEKARKDSQEISSFADELLPTVKEKVENALTSINDNKKLIEDAATKFAGIEQTAEENASVMQTAQADLEAKIKTLNDTHAELEGIVEAVTELENDAAAAKQSVTDDVTAIETARGNFDTLNTETQNKAKELKTQQEGIQKLLTEVQGAHSNVVAYKQELLDEKTDSNGNPIQSIKTQIHTLHTSTQDKFDEIEQERLDIHAKFEELEAQLKTRIEALLPGAGAAGLAHAYYDAKSRYALLPFRSDFKNKAMVCLHFLWHHVAGGIRHSVNHLLFIAPLLAIVWLFVDMLTGSTPHGVAIDGQGLDAVANIPVSIVLFRFLLTIPLGFLSWFGFWSIQLNRKLYEEYNHKQRVMQTYHSFEKEIDETGKAELKESLLKIMLGVVAHKPALTMADYQKTPDIKGIFDALNPFKGKGTGATEG